jgi:hypothetical protein
MRRGANARASFADARLLGGLLFYVVMYKFFAEVRQRQYQN